jgi:tetratricopeptide (TPR) repeat protein
MRRTLALTLFVLAAFAGNAYAATQARLSGKVIDSVTKKPIPDATINLTATEAMTYKADSKVKKDGSYAIAVLNGTIRYKFTYSAPGYRSYEEVMKLKLGEPNVKDVELTPAGAVSATVPGGEIKVDPSVTAFNDGAALANEGKDAEALVKFQEAVAAKPDLQAGWRALAKVSARLKKFPDAITAANKALELDADDQDMHAVLFEAYTATGDKAKAAAEKAKLPANAAMLFNDAAKAINAGKDGDAEPLLKQAIGADAAFAPAYYELGMLYVRSGKNADAKTNLEKYIELEPTGRDVATAKEMLKYVK